MPSRTTRRAALLAAGAVLVLPAIVRAQPAGRRLRLGHETVAGTPFGQYALAFAREVSARTGGRWTIDIAANGVLGNQVEMVRSIGSATLDLGIIAPLSLGGQIPPLEIFGMPFLFRDLAHARAVFDGPVGESYREAWATKELSLLGWGELGVRQLTANRPVPDAAALQGLKLRVPPSPIFLEVFRLMGAQPQATPWSQAFDALRTGALDAQENPISIIAGARVSEVQSHLMLTAHSYACFGLVASPDVMEDLNAEDRGHFLAAAEAGKAASRATCEQFDRDGLATLRQRGMTVVETPDLASFRRAREAATPMINKTFGEDALRRIAAA
jgi:tripartite ATP-independent transporter DctP family solute receptor